MPRIANPPPGWTQRKEDVIKGYAESGFDWKKDTTNFSSQEHRNYASSRYYSHRRRSTSLTPPRSNMTSKSDKSDDELAVQMNAMSLIKQHGCDPQNMHSLKKGIKNPDSIILAHVQNIPVGDGTSTDAAMFITNSYPLVYTLDTKAELVDSKNKHNKATSAVIIERPSLASIYTHKTTDGSTNMSKFSAKLKSDTGIQATATDDAIAMATGQVLTELKSLPATTKFLYNLPTAKDLGAHVGRMYDGEKEKPVLAYHTGHFNGNDGNKLKAQYVKLEFEYQGVTEDVVVYGFLIPIKGTESIYNLKSPTAATDQTDKLKAFLGRGLPTHSPISPVGDNIATSTSPRQSSTQAVLAAAAEQLKAEVEKKAEEKLALKLREKILEEKEGDLQDKFALVGEKEQALVLQAALLKEQQDAVAKQLQHVMERENNVEVTRVELMEQNAALEDRERKMKESEFAISNIGRHVQSALIQNEAQKQQLHSERENLNLERSNLARKVEEVEREAAAAATATLVLDESCLSLNDEVHEDALVPLDESVIIEHTHQQKVCFSYKDAEELDAKVTAQEQYKKSVDGNLLDDSIGLAGGLLELEDVDVQQGEQQAISTTCTKSIAIARPSISSKKKVKKKALVSASVPKIRSPKNTIKMQITEERMIRQSKRILEMDVEEE